MTYIWIVPQPLTSKRCILYIYSTNIGTEYFKHALYSPFFSSSKCSLFQNGNLFGSCIIQIFYTGCAIPKEIILAPKGSLVQNMQPMHLIANISCVWLILFDYSSRLLICVGQSIVVTEGIASRKLRSWSKESIRLFPMLQGILYYLLELTFLTAVMSKEG